MLEKFFEFTAWLGGDIMWGPWTFFGLLGAGLLFTIWTKFTQYRSMTHGMAVIRGKYDNPYDTGAINHFQALSAALSATIGLGNIGGVALAIGAGGPGALVWMWLTGVFGMALKTVEITLSQMYRNVDDPDNPHGGAMWVVEAVVASRGGVWKIAGRAFACFFCITLLISAITGGNMFQSWNVSNLTSAYFGLPRVGTGIVLAVIVGLVIIGGIKRIGTVAGKLVPLMCVIYLLSALAVLAMHISDIPGYFVLIFNSAFSPNEATGAFLGGTAGWAFSQGLRRALFSNEAGQGSAPIAHAAAKTDEPAREGIIGGIGPFIDTLCICTLTGLVILSTGTWNRDPLMQFSGKPLVTPAFTFESSPVQDAAEDAKPGERVFIGLAATAEHGAAGLVPADKLHGTLARRNDNFIVQWDFYSTFVVPDAKSLALKTISNAEGDEITIGRIAAMPAATRGVDDGGSAGDASDDRLMWSILTEPCEINLIAYNRHLLDNLGDVFTVVVADLNTSTNLYNSTSEFRMHRLEGQASLIDGVVRVNWGTIAASREPKLAKGTGMYRAFDGATLTAHAFDRQFPGLGKWLVTLAAWLFAISTMISWSYYGEQGMVYMFSQRSVIWYKFIYLAAIIFAAGWINDTRDMENLMDLGTGAMLWANIPIVVCLGFLAVRCLWNYERRLKAGEFTPHDTSSIADVVSGRNSE